MSTLLEYDTELAAALVTITSGVRRISDVNRDDRIDNNVSLTMFQLAHSAAQRDRAGSADGNNLYAAIQTEIRVFRYLSLAPTRERERDYTLGDMITFQDALLEESLWLTGAPNPPAYALTTVYDFWGGVEVGGPALEGRLFERTGRVIWFQIDVAINLQL